MSVATQIGNYIESLPERKRGEMNTLHELLLATVPDKTLWFLDGKNEANKTVSNPNIGYGNHTILYANATTKAFYKIGLSATTSGISVYVFGVENKTYLSKTYGDTIGKAKITGYCIAFKSINDIHLHVLHELIIDVCKNVH